MLDILNERVKSLITEKGISKAYISRELGIGYSTLWRRLKGERNVNVDFLSQLAKILGTTPSYLMGETDKSDCVKHEKSSDCKSDNKKAPEEQDKQLGLSYWGEVVDNMRALASSGNENQISLVYSLLKSGLDELSPIGIIVGDRLSITDKSTYAGHHNHNGVHIDKIEASVR